MQLNASCDHSSAYSEFSEIGPIPPPRMFSDSVLSNFSEHFINVSNALKNYNEGNNSNMESAVEVNDSTTKSLPPIHHFKQNSLELAHNSSLPMCLVRSQLVNEPTSVIEEVPTKEPQLSAVPKKSALKKPRITGSDSDNQKPTPNPVPHSSSPSVVTSNTCTSSPMITRPQPSPRYVYNCVQQTPMQIVVTSSQHNSHLINQNGSVVSY